MIAKYGTIWAIKSSMEMLLLPPKEVIFHLFKYIIILIIILLIIAYARSGREKTISDT